MISSVPSQAHAKSIQFGRSFHKVGPKHSISQKLPQGKRASELAKFFRKAREHLVWQTLHNAGEYLLWQKLHKAGEHLI
jgi:hypothetical protein